MPHRFVICFSLLTFLVISTGSAQDPDGPDQIITEDTTWTDASVDVPGTLVITSNATLTLQGTHLRIGDNLRVEEGSSLHITDSTQRASRIGASDATTGYWMDIQGTLQVSGEKTTQISGLTGTGLDAAHSGIGGIQIHGHADLSNALVHGDATALIIAEGGTADIDSTTIQTNDYAIVSMGTLKVKDSQLTDNLVGVLGFQTCDITIDRTTIRGGPLTSENLVMNGCKATVSDSTLEGARVSTVANNEANLTVINSTLSGYSIDGIGSYASPGETGMLRPSIRFEDVTFDPAPGAKRGAELVGSEAAEFTDIRMAGHSEHGIKAESANLAIEGSVITSNGGYGIELISGRFTTDPLQANNGFGVMTDEENGLGAIRHVMLTRFVTVDKDGQPLYGDLSVLVRQNDGRPVSLLQPAQGNGSAIALFEAYEIDTDGRITSLGPFTYEATLEDGQTWSGTIDPAKETIPLVVKRTPLETLADFAAPLLAVGLGVLLVSRRLRVQKETISAQDDSLPPMSESKDDESE